MRAHCIHVSIDSWERHACMHAYGNNVSQIASASPLPLHIISSAHIFRAALASSLPMLIQWTPDIPTAWGQSKNMSLYPECHYIRSYFKICCFFFRKLLRYPNCRFIRCRYIRSPLYCLFRQMFPETALSRTKEREILCNWAVAATPESNVTPFIPLLTVVSDSLSISNSDRYRSNAGKIFPSLSWERQQQPRAHSHFSAKNERRYFRGKKCKEKCTACK